MKQPSSEQILESAMRQVESRVRWTRWQLERRVRNAETPLQVWDRPGGLVQLEGDVLIVEPGELRSRELINLAHGQGFGADVARNAREAMSLIRIRKYDMVFTPQRRRSEQRLIQDIRRNFPGIRLVILVRSAQEGREAMRQGAYSYLLPDYPADQASTCIQSGLYLHKRVCQVQLRGDACDRSCVANFMQEGVLEEFQEPILEDPSLAQEEEPRRPQELAFYQKVE